MTPPDSEAAAPVGTLQTDTFCESCGYNLHAQIVTRDERLNLLVCRCPECGRFAAAGQGSTIGRVWLNRLGTLILVVWVMFLFFGFGLTTLFMGILPYSHLRSFTRYDQVSEFDSHTKSVITRPCYTLDEGRLLTDDEIQSQRVAIGFMAGTATVLAFLVGTVHSVFFWHVRGAGRLLALAFPLVAVAGASTCWLLDIMNRHLHAWGMARLGGYLLLESIGVVVGLAVGRPIARAILRWFIPAKPRQHLAFLWTIDGMKPPL